MIERTEKQTKKKNMTNLSSKGNKTNCHVS